MGRAPCSIPVRRPIATPPVRRGTAPCTCCRPPRSSRPPTRYRRPCPNRVLARLQVVADIEHRTVRDPPPDPSVVGVPDGCSRTIWSEDLDSNPSGSGRGDGLRPRILEHRVAPGAPRAHRVLAPDGHAEAAVVRIPDGDVTIGRAGHGRDPELRSAHRDGTAQAPGGTGSTAIIVPDSTSPL